MKFSEKIFWKNLLKNKGNKIFFESFKSLFIIILATKSGFSHKYSRNKVMFFVKSKRHSLGSNINDILLVELSLLKNCKIDE